METNWYLKKVIILFLLFSLLNTVAMAASVEENSPWVKYAEGIFVFEKDFLNSIVLVSDNEVLIMDPYYTGHALALQQAIAERFALPVKYVVYSHAHADHIRGANVFSDTAKFIASSSQIERLKFYQRYEDTIVMPDITFNSEYKMNFGGREIILRDYGPNHATGITVMLIPQEHIVAVYDIVYPKRLLWHNMEDDSPRGILYTLQEVSKEDFDTCITSHGKPASREEFMEFIGFMDDLISQVDVVVKDLMKNYSDENLMNTVASFSENIDLSKYKDWGFYNEWHTGNIEGVFHSIYMGY